MQRVIRSDRGLLHIHPRPTPIALHDPVNVLANHQTVLDKTLRRPADFSAVGIGRCVALQDRRTRIACHASFVRRVR